VEERPIEQRSPQAALAARVSVVIPTYNRRHVVGDAIQSVLAQSLGEFQLIVVDDGSTDGTADDLRERHRGDPRVHVVSRPNGGTAAARNTGIAGARARYTAFLDSDDRWKPDYLGSQLARLEATGADAVLCDALYEGGRRRGGSLFRDPWFVAPSSLGAMFRGGWGLPSALLVRTEVARRLGFNEAFRYSEDTEFLLRFHASGHRCVLNSAQVAVYRPDVPDGKTTGTWFEHLVAGVQMFHPLRHHRAARLRTAHLEYTLHRGLSKELVRAGFWREARPHLAACVRHRPWRPRGLVRLARSVLARPAGAPLPARLVERSARVRGLFEELLRPAAQPT